MNAQANRLYIVILAQPGQTSLHTLLVHASSPDKALETGRDMARARRPGYEAVGVLTQEDVTAMEMLLEGGRTLLASGPRLRAVAG